jgi:hypothetical protein
VRSLFFCLLFSVSVVASADVPAVTIRGLTVDFSPFTLIAARGERLTVTAPQGFEVALEGKRLLSDNASDWIVEAPTAPGLYALTVSNAGGIKIHVNLLVMVAASAVKDHALNGYRIGPPPPGNSKHPALYQQPAGFIEVTEDMLDLQLTPHFQLWQFLCKQEDGYPKYLVLQERLLVLLEGLLQTVRNAGYPAQTFGVISGYRTPWYNKKIGNVANSRHVYGDAMDLFVDMNNDGRMDDLNRDGVNNRADVDLLADMAEKYMTSTPTGRPVQGGVGRYSKNSRHGGFVHVDTRGYFARW